MDFIFKDASNIDRSALTQGDVIARTPEVIERISQAHQYYATAQDYSHFVVVTQSCDLVRRGGVFKAPYITIAAAKPFQRTLSEYFSDNSKSMSGADFSFHPFSVFGKARELIERYINNTEPDFFFLPMSGHAGLPEDLVVFLRLSIALRKEHYDALASSKIAELDDVFQAKLGWLKGNIYSRVATPDIEERSPNAESIKQEFFEKYIPTTETTWLSSIQAQYLRREVKKMRDQIGRDLTREEVIGILESSMPSDAAIMASNIVEKLKNRNLIDRNDLELQRKFIQAIASEPTLLQMVNNASQRKK